MGFGLTLAIFTSMMLRALHSGSDISAFGMFHAISLGLAVIALYLLFRAKAGGTVQTQGEPVSVKMGRVHAYTLGLTSVVVVLYFAFTAPNVIARWAGVSKLSVFGTLVVALDNFWLVVDETENHLIETDIVVGTCFCSNGVVYHPASSSGISTDSGCWLSIASTRYFLLAIHSTLSDATSFACARSGFYFSS